MGLLWLVEVEELFELILCEYLVNQAIDYKMQQLLILNILFGGSLVNLSMAGFE